MKLKSKRMFSGEGRYHKFDIAHGQLEQAIRLFLIDGCDMFSALTLAGAAGAILHQLVLDDGKEPFVDFTAKVHQWQHPGHTPSRSKIMSHIHAILHINDLKHQDPEQEKFVEFNAEESALAAIMKAMADYKTLTGEQTEGMKGIVAWVYLNTEKADSEALMKAYEAAPAKLK